MAGPSLRITLGQHSQVGHKGGNTGRNQDFHGAIVPTGQALRSKGIAVALADGIGSSPVSHIASAAAVRGFLDDYYATSEAWSVRRAALRVLSATNAWLHAQNQRSDARFDKDRGQVCTFSALILKDRSLHLLHVGDSRIYRLHAQALEQLTQDHRVHLGGEGAGSSYLGRALGVGASVEIDYQCWPAEVGEVYLLATDGACAGLDAARVHAALQAHADDLDAAARQLVQQAQACDPTDPDKADDATLQLLRVDALPAAGPTGSLQAQREGLALPPPLSPRMRFEGFTLVRELHVGPRSHVHLAIDDATGASAVLKIPSIDQRDNGAHLDSFVLEEWVARRVDSPHVLKALALERPRRHLFVAMEYVDGQTLAQWMVDHPRPGLDAVRGLVEQIARGLQALHQREMLHQDLRPENVMIDRHGTVKLIDLASAWVAGLHDDARSPGPRTPAGSLQYTAPEYFTGEGGSARSDLFALAVLSYQLLAGQLPYGLQVTRVRGVADARRLQYEPLRTHRPDLPAWVDAVLLKALHPQPHQRQEAVSEFVYDLCTPGAAFTQPRRQPLVERHPVRFWQACTALLAVALVAQAAWQVLGR